MTDQKGPIRQLAPVMIGTYNRLDHLQQTVAALRANTLAPQTELFLFSDAPRPGDEAGVAELREYLRSIDGFARVHITERKTNDRVANCRGGWRSLVERYGQAIIMAEDIVTAPGFLSFMNTALQTYASNPRVLGVSGYLPPIEIPPDHPTDAVAIPRFVMWGGGTWRPEFERFGPITEEDYSALLGNPALMQQLDQVHGSDLLGRFRAEANGHLNSLDTRASYQALLHDDWCIYPRRSLVRNIGHDGSGVHSALTDKYEVELWDKQDGFVLAPDEQPDAAIIRRQRDFFSDGRQDVSGRVLDALIADIERRGLRDFSLWGIDVMTDLFLQRVQDRYCINHFIDSWAQPQTRYRGRPVVTPSQALEAGERQIVIMSFASRHQMQAQLQAMAPDCEVVMYTPSEVHT